MEKLKEILLEIKEEVEKKILIGNPRELLYLSGKMNLLNEIFDIINEIENKELK